VLAGHADVVESAIIAKPCPVLGERVHAVDRNRHGDVSGEACVHGAPSGFSDYKVPETMALTVEAAAGATPTAR